METKPVIKARWSLFFRYSYGSLRAKETKVRTWIGAISGCNQVFLSVSGIIMKFTTVEKKYMAGR